MSPLIAGCRARDRAENYLTVAAILPLILFGILTTSAIGGCVSIDFTLIALIALFKAFITLCSLLFAFQAYSWAAFRIALRRS